MPPSPPPPSAAARCVRRLFCDWHMPSFLPEVRLDAEAFIEQAVALGAQSLNFMCKTAFGECLYPSAVERSNRAIPGDGDAVGPVFRLARQRGLRIIAYYNMVLNDRLAEDHAEWKQTDLDGKPLKMFGYHCFCMNRAPFFERVARTLEEIATRYEPDGFFFDLQYFHPEGCFCDCCKEGFQNRFGYPLDPRRFDSLSQWLDVETFQRESRRAFIGGAVERLRKLKPNLVFTWNGSGALHFSHTELDAAASLLTSEAHPPDFIGCGARAKWMQSSGKPFNLTMPETLHSWGDWTLVNTPTLKTMCAIALAHGGTIEINHCPMPCGDHAGKVYAPVYDLIRETFRWMYLREPLCEGARPVPVAAVVHAPSCAAISRSLQRRARLMPRIAPKAPLEGADKAQTPQNDISAIRLLTETHIPSGFVYSENHLDGLEDHEVVILANAGHVTPRLAERLRRYVSGGGRLLATYNTSLLDPTGKELDNFALADLFGADFRRFSPYSIIYLDRLDPALARGVPDFPQLVKDCGYNKKPHYRSIYTALRPGARALAVFTEPAIETDLEAGFHVYHDHAPPCRTTDTPAIIHNRFGQGQCVFMPFPFFETYAIYAGPWLRQVFRGALAVMGVPAKASFDATPFVHVVLTQKEASWLVHLVPVQQEPGSVLITEQPHTGPVTCRLRPPFAVAAVRRALNGQSIPFTVKDGCVTFTVPELAEHEIIEVRA